MAKQKSIIRLDGTIGGITFYKSGDGYLAREKGGVSGDRIKSDPNFQRTRENNQEFGTAGIAGKVLRNSVRAILKNSADGRVTSRMTKDMMKVVKSDEVNPRGKRNVLAGDLQLLNGFEFNLRGKLGTTMYTPFTAEFDRPTGVATISLEDFVPLEMINAPMGTTHFKIVGATTEIRFTEQLFKTFKDETAIQPWDNSSIAATDLTINIPSASTHPVFMVLGLEFYQEVNDEMYELKNGAYNSYAIVQVSTV